MKRSNGLVVHLQKFMWDLSSGVVRRSLQTVGWQTNEHGRGCPTVVYTCWQECEAKTQGLHSCGRKKSHRPHSSTLNIFLLELVSLLTGLSWIESISAIHCNRNASIHWTPPKAAQITSAQTQGKYQEMQSLCNFYRCINGNCDDWSSTGAVKPWKFCPWGLSPRSCDYSWVTQKGNDRAAQDMVEMDGGQADKMVENPLADIGSARFDWRILKQNCWFGDSVSHILDDQSAFSLTNSLL